VRLGADLDAICLRALRKAPLDRYRTVEDFAADLRRHLAGLPVEARRGGVRYRAGRFVARHGGRLGTAAALALALGAVLYAVGAQRPAEEVAPAALAARTPAKAPPDPRPFPFSPVDPLPVEELERRFHATPASLEAGAALVLGYLRAGRLDEADLMVARLRQIPGRQDDPLADYLEGHVAWRRQRRQHALVLMTRSLERALAGGRGELVAHIRATRGRLLSTLGQREVALREMALARADFERAGDLASLAWVLNALAIENLQAGRLGEGQGMLEAALAATRELSPTDRAARAVYHSNLGGVALLRGRPDLAELHYRETLAAMRATGRQHRIATSLAELSRALRELGKVAEADAALAESIELIRRAEDREGLAGKLLYRGEADLEAGRLASVPALADEIAALAAETGDRLTLVRAAALRGQLAAERGDDEVARRQLGEASRLARDNGDAETAAALALRLAEMERALGNGDEAARLIEQARSLQGGERYEGASEVMAQLMLARAAAAAGRLEEARGRVAGTAARAEGAPSVELRLTFLAARAELASAEGRHAAARRDVESALAVAARAGRKVAELELRLLLARVLRAEGDEAGAREAASAVAEQAERLGLGRLAAQARAAGGGP
jgi:serine/threonine-protein kinase